MEHGIQPASRDQRHLLSICVQTQFQHTVGGIAHQLDGAVRKPATNHADHLMRPHPYCLVPLAQPFTHLWGCSEHTQERQSPSSALSREGSRQLPSRSTVGLDCLPTVFGWKVHYHGNDLVC